MPASRSVEVDTAAGDVAGDLAMSATSSAQETFWLADTLQPGTPGWHTYRACRVCGQLDVAALRTAWRMLLDRHELLRARLIGTAVGPTLGSADRSDSAAFIDFSECRLASPAGVAQRWCVERAAAPFRLQQGPLARLSIVRLARDEHWVMLVAHPAAADERSLSILVEDLSATYGQVLHAWGSAPAAGRPRYADYVRRERAYLSSEGYRASLHWWKSAVPVPASPLALPADRHRPATSWRGDTVAFRWDAGIGRALTRLCRIERVTPHVIILAAYHALLGRYGGQSRVPVGVCVDTRPPAGFDRVVGPFGNVLVLCGDLAGAPTFRELVRRVDHIAREARRHRNVPLTRLASACAVDLEPANMPWCDAMIVYADQSRPPLALPGAEVHPLPLHHGAARADVALVVDEFLPAPCGVLEFRTERFEPESAAMLLEQLRTLLATALEQPDMRVDALPLETPESTGAATAAANRITTALPTLPVHEAIRRRAAQHPDAIAVATAGSRMTYRDLDRAAHRIAAALEQLGGIAGRPVALRMASGATHAAASLGVLRAGGHLLWLGAGETGERAQEILTELRPGALLVAGDPAEDALAAWYRTELGGQALDVRALERAEAPVATAPARVDANLAAYVAYTSGSTGKPKGVVQTHGALAQFAGWMAAEFRIGPGRRVAQWTAVEHDPALCEIFATLVAGATLCPVPDRIRAHPEKLVDWLSATEVTFLQTVPSLAREILRTNLRAGLTSNGAAGPLSHLECLVLMGEAVPARLANGLRAALPFVRLANIYGPTETIAATWHDITDAEADSVPIGRSIPGRQVLVLDDADRPCPTGVTGQIVVHSPYVAAGYVGGGSAAAAFRPVAGVEGASGHRWYRTGDLGRRRRDGRLDYRGRADLQVKVAGTRMELTDVETVLAGHETVAECAVVPVLDADGLVTRLTAYVVPSLRPAPDNAVWRTHLRRRFGASLRLISFVTLHGPLPRNIVGKVDRRRLYAVAQHAWSE